MFKRILVKWHSKMNDFLMLLSLPTMIKETKDTATPITFADFIRQKIIGRNRNIYWQVHPQSVIRNPRNIFAGVGVSPGIEKGCYIQAVNPIYIGDYTLVANNVGIISANHDLGDLRKHRKGNPIIIGDYCWLGMGSIVLPEVELGDFTIVGAGAVVTKSFPEGYCVIAGNPAKIVKLLTKENCLRYKSSYEYYGFYKKGKKFDAYLKKKISSAIKRILIGKNKWPGS